MAQSGLCPATRHNDHKNTKRTNRFLGGGNFHCLREEILFLPKEEGGHGVVDIKSRLLGEF